MSSGTFSSSHWLPVLDDRALLLAAERENRGWDVVYYAKRLMQTNSTDADAERAIRDLGPISLQFREDGVNDVNPVLGLIKDYSRVKFIRASQLIERNDGEYLCNFDDAGDTMFVILHGQVDIVVDKKSIALRSSGDIIGELACALHRRRTAAMRCIGHTRLLGFSYHQVQAQLQKSTSRSGSRQEFDEFLMVRTIRYICMTSPCLSITDFNRLHISQKPWRLFVEHAKRLQQLPDGTSIDFSDPIFSKNGIYILVSGSLRKRHLPDSHINGDDLPVVYGLFPDRFVTVNMQYIVEGEATLIFIAAASFKELDLPTKKSAIQSLASAVGNQFYYDIFISYTFQDYEIVSRWKDAFENASFRVFMDSGDGFGRFPERIAAAILDSRVFVPFISANTKDRPLDENWVKSEIDYRRSCFDASNSQIVPVKLTGGSVPPFADGFVYIDAQKGEAQAMREVIEAVRRVQDGRECHPFATQKRLDVKLATPKISH